MFRNPKTKLASYCNGSDLKKYRQINEYTHAEIYCTSYKEFALIQLSLELSANTKLSCITKFQHPDGKILFKIDIADDHENLEYFLRNNNVEYTPIKLGEDITSVDSIITSSSLEQLIEFNIKINFAVASALRKQCKTSPKCF